MIDIIMPTWIPNLEIEQITIQCLQKIKKDTRLPYRIVWIDDGSKPENIMRVKNEIRRYNHISYIFEKNGGFSVAANKGIDLSDSKYFVLLSNDVFVTDGWLSKLVEILEKNPKIGIISPVTTSAGKWQPYKRVLEKFGWELGDNSPEDFFNKQLTDFFCVGGLAFFCVVIRRIIVDKIGYFCEKFYCGGEDIDYSERTFLAGWKLAICLNCFVYHKHWTTRNHILNYKQYGKSNANLLRQRRLERSK